MTGSRISDLAFRSLTPRERLAWLPSDVFFMHQLSWLEIKDFFSKRILCESIIERVSASKQVPVNFHDAHWLDEINKILTILSAAACDVSHEISYNPIAPDDKLLYFLRPVLIYMERKIIHVFKTHCLTENVCKSIMKQGFAEIIPLFDGFILESLNEQNESPFPLALDELSDHYDTFSYNMLHNGGYMSMFKRHPVLGRKLIARIDKWHDYINIFAERINKHETEISQCFGCSGNIIDINFPNGIDSVVIVKFANGRSIVYKTRAAKTDSAFWEFIKNLVKINAILPINQPTIKTYGEYSISEFVEKQPLRQDETVQNFYIRAGQLMCVLYLLGGRDFHRKNLIVSGEQLIPIDLEMILAPKIRLIGDEPKMTQNAAVPPHSVLTSGMLFYNPIESEEYKDTGGITILKCEDANEPYTENGFDLNIEPDHKQEFILIGFEQTYKSIMRNKQTTITSLDLFENCDIRILVREQRSYRKLIKQLMQPFYLKDGITQSLEAEQLFNSKNNSTLIDLYNIYEEEHRAVLEGSEPRFHVKAGSRDIKSYDKVLRTDYFEVDALSRAKERIKNMNIHDLNCQRAQIIKHFSTISRVSFPNRQI